MAGRDHRGHVEDRVPPNQAILDTTIQESLSAIRIAPAERHHPPVPEVTALINKITEDRPAGEYRLHIKRVLGYKHWDKRQHQRALKPDNDHRTTTVKDEHGAGDNERKVN
jgi:hypothetical protein